MLLILVKQTVGGMQFPDKCRSSRIVMGMHWRICGECKLPPFFLTYASLQTAADPLPLSSVGCKIKGEEEHIFPACIDSLF